MERMIGDYLGTAYDRRFWRKYRRHGFHDHGIGEYWFDKDGLNFRRYLTKVPLHIPYKTMHAIENASWHLWRWSPGRKIVKIHWIHENHTLCSGFILARNQKTTQAVTEKIQGKAETQTPTPVPA